MLSHRTVDVTRTPAVTPHISSHRPSDSTETALKVSMTAPRERNTAQGESTGVDAACTVTRAAAQTLAPALCLGVRGQIKLPSFFNGDRRYVTQIRSD